MAPPALPESLEGLAAWSLARQRIEGHGADPVARFHLGHGARLERINWLADIGQIMWAPRATCCLRFRRG
jgi:hypothetical protein